MRWKWHHQQDGVISEDTAIGTLGDIGLDQGTSGMRWDTKNKLQGRGKVVARQRRHHQDIMKRRAVCVWRRIKTRLVSSGLNYWIAIHRASTLSAYLMNLFALEMLYHHRHHHSSCHALKLWELLRAQHGGKWGDCRWVRCHNDYM